MNAVQRAAFQLRIDDLQRQIAEGADLSGALLAACSAHDPSASLQRRVIRLLTKSGARVQETDKNGVTPLHRAVRFRSPFAVAELIRLGADVNAVDRRSGSTPLHRAVTNTGAPTTAGKGDEAVRIVQQLIDAGADHKIRNKQGRTAGEYVRDSQLQAVFDALAE